MALRLIQSGYGDKRDLKAVAPKREEATLDFEARWRMLGRRVHKDEAYTKQDFTYGVHYEGERVSKYNEAPYHSNIIAHPKRCFPYAVEQHMSLPIQRLWETRADFYATVQKNTLKYALEFEGDYQIPKPTFYKVQFSVKRGLERDYSFADFFDGAKTIGQGRWEKKDGKVVQDLTNSNTISGIFGTVGEIKDIKDYVAEFDFSAQFAKDSDGTINGLPNNIKFARSPITSRPDETGFLQAPGADDDLVGVIFRAKDVNNFYCMLVEGERRIFPGTRAGNLTGMRLTDNYIEYSKTHKNSPGLPNFLDYEADAFNVPKQQFVTSVTGDKFEEKFRNWELLGDNFRPRNPSKGAWESFVKNSGWGLQHKQIYKVENGVLSRVDVTCNNKTGFLLDGSSQTMGEGFGPTHKIIVTTSGSNVTISMNDRPGAEQYQAFSFQTDWDEGGIGALNVSQAVKFIDIKVKRVDTFNGTLPEEEWEQLNEGEKVIADNATEYVKSHYDYERQLQQAGIDPNGAEVVTIMGIDKEGDASNIEVESLTGKITVRTKFQRESYSSRLPEGGGWFEHDGFVNGAYQPEFIHFPNIADALKEHAEAKGLDNFEYRNVKGIVENEAFGRVTTGFAFVAISNNAPDAGKEYHEYHYKCGTQTVTPDNYDEATCVNAFEDIAELTRLEENNFFNKRPDWDESSFSKEYQVTKPVYQEKSPGPPQDALETNPNTDCFIPNPEAPEPEFDECDIDFIFDGQSLCMWSCEFPIDIQVKNFTDCVYAYQGRMSFNPFSEFTPNPWTHYKVFMDKEFVKDEHDSIMISGDQLFTNIAVGSTLFIETNEHYYSDYGDEGINNGIVTSLEDIIIKVPDFPNQYVDPIFYDAVNPNYNPEEVHYLLDAWMNHEDVKIRFITDQTKRDGTIPVDPDKVTTQGLLAYSDYAHDVEAGNYQQAVHGKVGMPILKVEDKRYQGIDSRFFIEVSCVKRMTRYKWNSGELKQQASVNGLVPLRGKNKGKQDYGPIDLSTILIPDDIDPASLSKPIVITDNPDVKHRIRNNELYFYSDKLSEFEWYSPWVGEFDYHKEPLQADTVGLTEVARFPLPTFYDVLRKHRNVIVDHIELEATSPFVLLRLSRSNESMIKLINERNTSEDVSLIAKVKDSYPRVWFPLVQSGYYYLEEQEYYLYSKRGYHYTTDTSPIKQVYNKVFADGAPILIQHNGVWLRKSQFIKEGALDHIYEQTTFGKGFDRIYFDFSTVDPTSIQLRIDGQSVPSTEYTYKGDHLLLSQPLTHKQVATVYYAIEESFFIQMRNQFIDKQEPNFSAHLYNPSIQEDNETIIYYEQDGELPFYKHRVATNPVHNRHGKGFLYINKNEKLLPTRITVEEVKGEVDHDWEEKVPLVITVYDQYGASLENEPITVEVDGIVMLSQHTNDSGEVYMIVKPSSVNQPIEVVAKHDSASIEGRTTILKKRTNKRTNKIVRVLTEHTLVSRANNSRNGYEVKVLTPQLLPLAQEPVDIVYYDDSGNTLQATLRTNAKGEASSRLNLSNMTGERITIEATVTNASGQISKSKTTARIVR